MIHSVRLTLILAPFFLASLAGAQISEKERLSGFAEHHKNQERFEAARLKGERAYLEEEEQWEHQKSRTLESYKKSKKQGIVNDEGPEAKADAVAKRAYEQQYEQDRRTYTEKRSAQDVVVRESQNLPSELQELGLHEERPRYDYRKRAMFGGQPKYGSTASGGSGGSSRGGSISPGGTSFPPPPTFDDFGGGDGGYVPAPNMPEDYGDVPPPPPPPMPMGDDFGGFGGEQDFPPPPPPPPPFMDEGGGF